MITRGLLSAALMPRRLVNLGLAGASLLLKLEKPLGMPPILMVEPTNVCSFHCRLCPTGQNQATRSKGFMDVDRFFDLIDEVEGTTVYMYLWDWGEPLMHKGLGEMIAYAKAAGIYLKMSTNAHFLTAETVSMLFNAPSLSVDYLLVSLDGASEETYLKYREAGDFTEVVNNLIALVDARDKKKANTRIALQFIVMKHNEHEIPKIRELAKNIGVDELLLKTVSVDLIKYPTEEARKQSMDEYLPSEVYQRDIYRHAPPERGCDRLWTSSVIGWDGTVLPCCYDFNGVMALGNAFDGGFKAAWSGAMYAKLRRLLKKKRIGFCSTCSIGGGVGDFLNRFK
jgi:MoaA/NifB/PqqE/SkfB family radical SAM enzyme